MRRLSMMQQDLYKQKRSLELKWEQEHLSNGRYTLEMVKIDRQSQGSHYKDQTRRSSYCPQAKYN